MKNGRESWDKTKEGKHERRQVRGRKKEKEREKKRMRR